MLERDPNKLAPQTDHRGRQAGVNSKREEMFYGRFVPEFLKIFVLSQKKEKKVKVVAAFWSPVTR